MPRAAGRHRPPLRGRRHDPDRTGPGHRAGPPDRAGTGRTACEVSTIGGNTPQWLVNRAASDIAAGRLSVTLIAGAEAIRSSRARRAAGLPRDDGADASCRPTRWSATTGPGWVRPRRPSGCWPRSTSTRCSRAWWPPGPGHDAAGHRRAMGRLLAPFTEVAAAHPYAWFPDARTADRHRHPVARQPHRGRAVHQADDGLPRVGPGRRPGGLLAGRGPAGRGRRPGRLRLVGGRGHRRPVPHGPARSRPVPGHRRRRAGAVRGGAPTAAGRSVPESGVDDIELLDIYSCFPSAVELAAEALGLATDDRRGLTVTGGLPYFGGPGNNYTTHGIATLTDLLRERRRRTDWAWPPGSGGSSPSTPSASTAPPRRPEGSAGGTPRRPRPRIDAPRSRRPSRWTTPTRGHRRRPPP